MENEEKKTPRGLKDISHLFLSSAQNPWSRAQEKSHTRPVLAVGVDSWSDCAFEMNAALARNLELPIHQIDFHVNSAQQDSHDGYSASSELFCAPVVFEDLISDGEGKLCLVDFPWNFPDIIDALMPLVSAVLVTMRSSLGSLKNAFRFLKGVSCFLKEDPFVRWEEPGAPYLAEVAFQWNDLIKHFLNRDLVWLDNLQPFKERILNASSAVAAGPEPSAGGISLPQEEVLRRERQRSLHFQRDFLTTSSAEAVASEPSLLSTPFYERSRLSQEELAAFSFLAGRVAS